MFLLPAVWKFVAYGAAVIEIRHRETVASHLYQSCPVANRAILFPIAHMGPYDVGETNVGDDRNGMARLGKCRL